MNGRVTRAYTALRLPCDGSDETWGARMHLSLHGEKLSARAGMKKLALDSLGLQPFEPVVPTDVHILICDVRSTAG